ncbi:MAG: phage major capsid protein [Lachnospiraceae bacterium]|nr:phage major capsid protein [Lachnospiraceae bacterium]
MPKKLLELLDSINEKKELVQSLAEAGKLDEAAEAKKDLVNLQKKFDLLKDLEDEKLENAAAGKLPEVTPAEEKTVDSTHEFAQAARRGFRNAMNETTPTDGGYTVPEDIQTKINKYRDAKASLLSLVRRENVTTESGARTFKKRAQQTGFSKVGEGAAIGAKDTPQFERIEYKISKYAGYFPVTNELLADSDANITNVLTEWIGDESRVTANNLILEVIKTKEATDLEDMDGIKYAVNVTLGSAFKSTSRIITNDDGLQYLDTLKDGNGRYLLAPDPNKTMQMRLQVGAIFVPVEVIPNADMATADSKIPFIIGDLNEGIYFFDRQRRNIRVSDIAAIGDLNAFEQDLTLFRAIEREDVELRDSEAFVYGYITAGSTSAATEDTEDTEEEAAD